MSAPHPVAEALRRAAELCLREVGISDKLARDTYRWPARDEQEEHDNRQCRSKCAARADEMRADAATLRTLAEAVERVGRDALDVQAQALLAHAYPEVLSERQSSALADLLRALNATPAEAVAR